LLHTLHVGGAEVLAARLARRFAPSFRIVFACLDELGTLGEDLQRDGFPVHVLGRKPGLDWRCVIRLGKVLRQEGVDVIHAHQYTPFFYALLGRWFAGRPPILFTEHGRHFPDERRTKRVIANRILLSRRDRVVGVGEAVRQALIMNEGIPPHRVDVVYNGIDFERYRKNGADRLGIRREIGLACDDLVILQVARFDYLKDHATALQALKKVVESQPNARLVLAGDGPERGLIEKTIAELGLGDHVRLLGTRKDVARLLAAADIFLLTSISEGIPLTLIEGMAARLPIVATSVGGVPEVVEDGKTGLLAPAGDGDALAGHLLRLAVNPTLRQEMGERGSVRAQSLFSESQMVAQYDAMCRTMIGGRRVS
jgi:glycosyltransferase involved in cell wall biosynthesis